MSDSPFTVHGDEALEARIVSWVLGEASAFEEAELERLCGERPELLVFRRRMRALHGLLTEAEKQQPDDSWKLPPEKRRALDEIFGDGEVVRLETEKEKRVRRSGRRAFLAIAACLVLTAAVLRLLPWKQVAEAEVTLEVKSRSVGISPLGAEMAETSGESKFSPNFFGTEFEKIKSRNSLEKVVDNLDLTQRWGVDKETALKRVKDSIQTQNIRGTDLMSIRVREPNQTDARDIADEVAKTYKAYRDEHANRNSEQMLQELNKAVRDQEDKVEERRKVLATIVRTKGVIYKGDDSFSAQSCADGAGASKDAEIAANETREEAIKRGLDAQDYVDAKRDFETDQQLLQTMKLKLIGEQISGNAPSESVVVQSSPTVTEKNVSLLEGAVSGVKSLFENGHDAPAAVASAPAVRSDAYASEQVADEGGRQLAQHPSARPADVVSRSSAGSSRVMAESAGADRANLGVLAKDDSLKNIDGLSTFESKPGFGLQASRASAPAAPAPPATIQAVTGTAVAADAPALPDMDLAILSPSVGTGGVSNGGAFKANQPMEYALRFEGGTVVPSDSGELSKQLEAPAGSVSSELQSKSEIALTGQLAAGEKKMKAVEKMPVLGERMTAEGIKGNGTIPETEAHGWFGRADEGAAVAAGKLQRDKSWESNADAEIAAKPDSFFDTSKVSESNKPGGVEYEIQTGYSSEYLFKGKDLADAKGAKEEMTEGEKIAEPQRRLSAAPIPDSPELAAAIKNQEDKVEERRKVLATIVRTKGIIYKGTDSFYGQSGVDEDQGAKNALQTFHQLEQEKMQLESQINSLHKYDSDQLMVYAGGLDLPDNNIRKLYPVYQQAKRDLEALKINGMGDSHPSVQAANDQIQTMRRQLDEGVVNLRSTLQAKLDLATESLKGIETMKDEARESAIKRGLDAQDYVEAKREFEKEQELLQQLKLKASESSAKPVLPKPDLTKLMEEISAAEDPYSTFSLNISDASFKIAQAALAKGERPDPAGIKVEQFYNAVDYGDPAPAADEPVAVNIEQSAHPVIPGRNLVRVALKTAAAGRSAAQPLRLTLLVDQSGSMSREDRRAAMNKALAGLSGLVTANDAVSIVGFSRTPRLLADGLTGENAGKLADFVNLEASEGGTNLEEAIKLAGEIAERHKLGSAQNRIVLFTDGAANLGNADPVKLAEKVKGLRQKGIAFDIAGIAAEDLNDDLLGELARNGNGRYYIVGKGGDDNFAKQLAGAFRPAAENVKVQVRFNPERVGRYKLIGFEKDRLKTEDFRNDAVDAAELAAEEAGVAIYQVEPLPDGKGEIGEVSVRFRDTAADQMVERTWTIRHDSAAPAFDRATPSMQLATLAMLAAEKLKGGPLAEAIDFKELAAPAANVKRFYGTNGRPGEVLQMLDALK